MNETLSLADAAASGQELALLLRRHAPSDGTHDTAVPGLLLRRSSRASEQMHTVYTPSLCVVAQGAKTVATAEMSYRYDPSAYLVTSVHLPVIGKITEATPQEPYLSLQLGFSPNVILDIVRETGPAWPPLASEATERGISVNRMSAPLLDAIIRLVRLLDAPEDIPVLAPLITREIIYRVMQSDQGSSIRQFAIIGGHAHHIAKAIQLIKRDYARPLLIEELAKEVGMSPSALHKHFKKVTAISPLQYQKAIRLQEARRLLLSEMTDAAEAGFRVGYESASQFSREYARMFGRPPIRDVRDLRSAAHEPVQDM